LLSWEATQRGRAIAKRDDNLDIFWLKDEGVEEESREDPEELLAEALAQTESATDALRDLVLLLSPNRGEKK
jgi:hypothetical protein